MATPAKKKATYDAFSPKIAQKRKIRKKIAKEQRENPPEPPKVDNYRVNKPRTARSLNVQPVVAEQRKIASTEGMPAVNGKSGPEIVKKAVTKVRPKSPTPNVKDAALPVALGKDKSNGSKPKRTGTSSKGTSKS
jgi:hypothetical protein